MAMPKIQKSRSGKIEFRCYQCREACLAKNGDWHASPASGGSHQVFLCRACESQAKLSPKSLSPLY
jgi:hypothetical protein